MLLKDRIAVIYGGGGAIGGAAARAMAREGATVHLAGRTRARLEAVARDIEAAGGRARIAVLDALDEAAVTRHADGVAAQDGRIDIALNAVGIEHVQGVPALELSVEDFEHPIRAYARTHFLTAMAAARHMVGQRAGVILALSTPGSKLAYPGVVGFGAACAAIEAMVRHLAGELGPHGVRVLGLRPDAIPEAVAAGSHSGKVFQRVADRAGITVDQMLAEAAKTVPMRRFPRLDEAGRAAAFLASDHAGAMTGTTVNLSCGSVVD